MAENLDIESTTVAEERQAATDDPTVFAALRSSGAKLAAKLGWLPGTTSSRVFAERTRRVRSALKPILAAADAKFAQSPASDDLRWLRDNGSLVYAQMVSLGSEIKPLRKLPHVRTLQDRKSVV